MDEAPVSIYFFGEGKTDLGEDRDSGPPSTGVVPILVSTICGKPGRMRAKRRRYPFLQGKGLWKKVRFAKQQAFGRSAGAVFVVDSQGNLKTCTDKLASLEKGRDAWAPDFPMAVGVSQPSIEAWLLADPSAIRRALRLTQPLDPPEAPESLPAPCQDNRHNPKTVLASVCHSDQKDLAATEKWAIAAAMTDMPLARTRCPKSFAPFADEVRQRIGPLLRG